MLNEPRLSFLIIVNATKHYRSGNITKQQLFKLLKQELVILILTSAPHWPAISANLLRGVFYDDLESMTWKINFLTAIGDQTYKHEPPKTDKKRNKKSLQ